MKKSIIIPLLLVFQVMAYTQAENLSSLSIEQIMQGDEFVGYLPNAIEWSADSKTVYFDWNPEKDTLESLYKVKLGEEKAEKVGLEELRTLPDYGLKYNASEDQLLYLKDGDVYLEDVEGKRRLAITNTIADESDAFFTTDGRIVFRQGKNLFSWTMATGEMRQLTNFKKGGESKEGKGTKPEQWLKNDQLTYFDILKKRKNKRDARQHRSTLLDDGHPSPIYTGSKSVSNIKCSPDGRFVTYRLAQKNFRKRSKVMHHVTESGYAQAKDARAKVGGKQDTYQMGIYDTQRDTAYLVDVSTVKGIQQKAAFLEEYKDDGKVWKASYNKPREVIVHGPVFSDAGQAAVVLRSQDNKDRWIMRLDLASGNLSLLDRQRDEAWIGGPGISGWNFTAGNIGWLNESTLWYQSEATGYSHLYTVNINSGKKKQLTKGSFEIHGAQLSKDKQRFYITANKENPHEQHFYWMDAMGGKMTKITDKPGKYEVEVSPDEKQLAIRYSYSNQPWELYLMPNEAGAQMQQITKSTTPEFESYDWRDPEIVRFKARDGAKVPARLYKPEKPNGAAVIFVHGAGYLQNVHRWWSSYYREYMFHNILADNGYTVLDIDYRASEGYGRDWRTAIYRHMGGQDLEDQIDGAKYLVEEHNIDAERLGIYGGSYGGFITLMAQFTSPGTFKSGAALRSVTDWAHYNHPYTSNILNTPVEDSLAYYRSSPIYHADGLQDNLLILHGMVDSNVQFQDVVRLAQRLIELGKDDWEFAVFPVEGHGFQEASSWADEYKRIFKLFQETLQE